MSSLRARCPACRTLTAVAIGPDYQCHVCGREFGAGLVRVPRAWGACGQAMADAAWLELRWPEAAVIDQPTLAEQSLALAAELPHRPLVLGGCCCAHLGAIEGLSQRYDRLAVVWIDAHGDLNTPQSSPSGNPWGMPLRMLLDGGAIAADDVVLVGARSLDPPETEFIHSARIHTGPLAVDAALAGAEAVYVALDADSIDPSQIAAFMPEPNGLQLDDVERMLVGIAVSARVAGVGFTGLVRDRANEPVLERFALALGL